MMVMMMRLVFALQLMLQGRQGLLRAADISRLKRVFDLLHGLGERIVRVSRRAALRPRERSIGLLRPGEIARLNGFYELNEKLPGILRVGGLRIAGLKRGNTRYGHVVTS
jgi:hypothetical protein